MTEHLPECPVQTKDSICRCLPCICDALRACETRIKDEAVERVEVLYSKGHFIWDDGIESYGIPHKREVMTAIKGDQP